MIVSRRYGGQQHALALAAISGAVVLLYHGLLTRHGIMAHDGLDSYLRTWGYLRELMAGHGKVGRGFTGRVLQIITAATGLSDWEWGVTLLVDDPKAIKDVVYEMRYDEVSARYGEFGAFVVGLVAPFEQALGETGLRPS